MEEPKRVIVTGTLLYFCDDKGAERMIGLVSVPSEVLDEPFWQESLTVKFQPFKEARLTLEHKLSEDEAEQLNDMFRHVSDIEQKFTIGPTRGSVVGPSRHPQYDQIPRSAPRSAVEMRAELPFWAVQPKGDRTGKGERKRKGKNRWR